MPYVRDYYEAILDILGSPSCIIPIGDPRFENAARTTVTTKGRGTLDGLVFTYSKDRTTWDGKSYQRGRGSVLYQPFDGLDEQADTPTAAAWSRDDTAGEGFSFGTWMTIEQAGTARSIFAKVGGADKEWQLQLASDDLLKLFLYDESLGVVPVRATDVALVSSNVLHYWVITYDGGGGATAASGITIYEDGVVRASTAAEQGTYLGMEGLSHAVELGSNFGGFNTFGGRMGGGPLGFQFTHSTLSLAEIGKLHLIGLDALKDLPLLGRMRGMRAA